MRVAAASQLCSRHPSNHLKQLPAEAFRGVPDIMNRAEILRKKAVAWITGRESADDLDNALLAGRKRLPGNWISDDYVGEIRWVKEPVVELKKHTADLFDHAIEIVDVRKARVMLPGFSELSVAD